MLTYYFTMNDLEVVFSLDLLHMFLPKSIHLQRTQALALNSDIDKLAYPWDYERFSSFR